MQMNGFIEGKAHEADWEAAIEVRDEHIKTDSHRSTRTWESA